MDVSQRPQAMRTKDAQFVNDAAKTFADGTNSYRPLHDRESGLSRAANSNNTPIAGA
jgi:hypothetical protein